uniref:Rab-GAP TBC domain-containing protein n=1 Tax=Haemonchus contortus TaxID=6289 RepID=A0A7I4Z190_HAECO
MEQLNRSSEGETTNLVSQKSGSCISQRDDVSSRVEFDGEDLWNVWGDVIRNWEHEIKRNPSTIKMLVKRGIPQHFRTIAWQLLSNASVSTIHEVYSDYMRQSSVFEKVILRDIPRTFPEMGFFKDGGRGQASLFNVIKAYSIHDKEVGYCQGSAFIAGLLLMQMPEEEAFAVIVRLMENYRLRELYKPAMTELGLCIFQLDCLVQEQMPDLYTHFNNMGLDTSMYASSWFLTLFTTTMPIEIANRIMDCFFLEGMEFIFCVAMSILQQARVDLLRLDMEGMLKYFQRDVRERYECDADLLFAVASKVQLNPRKMRKLEKDYLTKRTKDQEEAVELRDLEAANKRLREHELFGGITILQDLQEELISVKMREAESNLAVKEMRQRLDELEQYWAKYVHARMSDFSYSTFSSDSTAASSEPSSPIPLNLARSRFAKITAPFVGTSSDDGDDYIAIRKLEDQLMGVRIKEAVNMAELKEMRQKVMKLETQRLVCTNRIRQQIDEMKRVRKELEAVQKAGSICNEPNGDLFSVGSENMIALLAKIVVNIPVLDDIAEEQSSSENKEMYDGSDTSNCDVPNS